MTARKSGAAADDTYLVLTAQDRATISRDLLRGLEDALYRAVIVSPDPDNDANVQQQRDRVSRAQTEFKAAEDASKS